MDTLIQIILSSLESGSIYALAALGLIIIFRTSFMINFAHGTMGMFNAFVAAYIYSKLGMPLFVAATAGLISAVLLGVVVDFTIIRTAKNVDHMGKQIITLGLIIFFLGISPNIFGTDPVPFDKFIDKGSFAIGEASILYNGILNIIIGIVIMFALFGFIRYTKWGLAVRVTAENEKTAKLMGVPTKTVTMGAWAVGSVLATLPAYMIADQGAGVGVGLMDKVQLVGLLACVFGGFQTFYGPVIGAYVIALSTNLFTYYISDQWSEPLLYVLILVFIIFRPNGLVGKAHIKKV